MTTITIERSLLERLYLYWLEDADPHELDEFTAQVRAALSAPATAPAQPAPERKPMPILEVNARWEQSVLDITRLQYYQVVREVEAFHGITGGKP